MRIIKLLLKIFISSFIMWIAGCNDTGIIFFYGVDEKEYRCLINLENFELYNCQSISSKEYYENEIPNIGKYKKFHLKQTEIVNQMKADKEHAKETILESCNKEFSIKPIRTKVIYDGPASYYRNSYYKYIYQVYKEHSSSEISILLCGIKNNKSEVVLGEDFYDYYSLPDGKYITIIKQKGDNEYLFYSYEPETKLFKYFFKSNTNIYRHKLNKYQSIYIAGENEILVFDHNKNKILSLGKFSSEFNVQHSLSHLISIKDKKIITLIMHSTTRMNYFLELNFKNNKLKPEISIVPFFKSYKYLGCEYFMTNEDPYFLNIP